MRSVPIASPASRGSPSETVAATGSVRRAAAAVVHHDDAAPGDGADEADRPREGGVHLLPGRAEQVDASMAGTPVRRRWREASLEGRLGLEGPDGRHQGGEEGEERGHDGSLCDAVDHAGSRGSTRGEPRLGTGGGQKRPDFDKPVAAARKLTAAGPTQSPLPTRPARASRPVGLGFAVRARLV